MSLLSTFLVWIQKSVLSTSLEPSF